MAKPVVDVAGATMPRTRGRVMDFIIQRSRGGLDSKRSDHNHRNFCLCLKRSKNQQVRCLCGTTEVENTCQIFEEMPQALRESCQQSARRAGLTQVAATADAELGLSASLTRPQRSRLLEKSPDAHHPPSVLENRTWDVEEGLLHVIGESIALFSIP